MISKAYYALANTEKLWHQSRQDNSRLRKHLTLWTNIPQNFQDKNSSCHCAHTCKK